MNYCKNINNIEAIRKYFLSFIYSLAMFATGFLLSYIILYIADVPTSFEISNVISGSDIESIVYSATAALIPAVITSLLLFAGAFTPLGGIISVLCVLWRGACLGCVVFLISSGSLIINSRFAYASIIMYFLASVLIFTLCALSSIFRSYIAAAYTDEKYSDAARLSVGFTKLFLIISGALYLLSTFTILFIQIR